MVGGGDNDVGGDNGDGCGIGGLVVLMLLTMLVMMVGGGDRGSCGLCRCSCCWCGGTVKVVFCGDSR